MGEEIMKFKKIMFVSILLLAILTLGAVSASGDADNLAAAGGDDFDIGTPLDDEILSLENTATAVGDGNFTDGGEEPEVNDGDDNFTDFGDSNFTDSDASNPIATVIVSSPVTTVFNGNKYLIATLKDIDGNALSGFEVSVDLNGVKILPTDENGQVKVSTNGLTPKTYDVAITFAGNENYTESNTTTKVVINKDSTKLSASAVATVYNVYKKQVITVKDSQGRALNVVKVSVNINGKTYTTMNVLVKIPFGRLVPKTYTAKISFAGNNNYNASSTTVNVTVKKATPKLTAAKKTFKKSVKTKKFTVTLKNNLNDPMESTLVTLNVNKKIYKVKTNAKGQATFKINNLNKKGTFTAVVKFAGNKYYNAKTVNTKITVK